MGQTARAHMSESERRGMISLLTIVRDGKAIETATIGKDGVFGGAAAFGLYRSRVRVIVQVAMSAATIPASLLRRSAENSKAIQQARVY